MKIRLYTGRATSVIVLSFVLVDCGWADELMYAVTAQQSQQGTLYTVNIETGAVQQIGPKGMGIGLTTTVNIATRPSDGALFLDHNSSPFDGLWRIDGATGLATFIGTNSSLNELAFDHNDVLYTQIATSTIGVMGAIGRVDSGTGSITPLTGPDLPRLFGLTYDQNNAILYGLTFDNVLYKLDLNGQILSTVSIASSNVPGAIAFDRNGQLFGTDLDSRIFDIDPDTGAISNIRFAGIPIQGLAQIVPEPSSPILMLILAVISAFRPGILRARPRHVI
jgi:hypothetical protein